MSSKTNLDLCKERIYSRDYCNTENILTVRFVEVPKVRQGRALLLLLLLLSWKSCPTLMRSHGLQPARLLCPWDFPGKNTGVGCHFLLQRVFPTQGSNLHLWHWQAGSSPLSHQGSPLLL